MSWRCVVRDHPPQTFETREGFLNHMTDAHPGRFRKEQLPFIAESSARALNPTVPACPFCAEDSGDLENHVAQHLCHFALQSLPWPDHLDQGSEIMSGRDMNSSSPEDVERETLKDELDDSLGVIDVAWVQSLETEPEPLLDTPVSWPIIERIFPEPDHVLNEFAAHAARRATIDPKDIHGKPETLDEELFQIIEQLPGVTWIDADMDTSAFSTTVRGASTHHGQSRRSNLRGPRLGSGPFPVREWLSGFSGLSGHSQGHTLRASLRGPWGFEGEHIMLNVKVAVPHAYPEVQAPSFTIEKDEHIPEVVRETLQREVHEICQLYLQRKETCLAAAFSYLLGERDLTSSLNMFNNERGNAIPLGDVDEDKPPASPVSQTDGLKFAEAADRHGTTEPKKMEAQPKSGYLTERRWNFGFSKSMFYIVEGPQLKYYDAAGGAQLGSIKLQGAQIGRQQLRDEGFTPVDTQYHHSMFILEPKKGLRTTRHVLCAESDEERDLWLDALLPWTNDADSDEMKLSKHDRSGFSESQTAISQLPTFLIQEDGKPGQFRPVDYLHAPYVNIASESIASSSINCWLDLPKSKFGTFEGLSAGIIYMDINITTAQRNLQSVTVTVTLDDEAPKLQQAIQGEIGHTLRSIYQSVRMTKVYEPKTMVISGRDDVDTRSPRSKSEIKATGIDVGGIGAEPQTSVTTTDFQAWKLSGQSIPVKDSRLHSAIRWHLSSSSVVPLLRDVCIHTGFLFQGTSKPFYLTVEIEGNPSKLSDRIRQISQQLGRGNRNSSRWRKILVNTGHEHQHQPLDEIARTLPEAMHRRNQLGLSLMNLQARSVHSGGIPSGHGLDRYVDTQEGIDPSSGGYTAPGI